jgi:hypothetical protein
MGSAGIGSGEPTSRGSGHAVRLAEVGGRCTPHEVNQRQPPRCSHRRRASRTHRCPLRRSRVAQADLEEEAPSGGQEAAFGSSEAETEAQAEDVGAHDYAATRLCGAVGCGGRGSRDSGGSGGGNRVIASSTSRLGTLSQPSGQRQTRQDGADRLRRGGRGRAAGPAGLV